MSSTESEARLDPAAVGELYREFAPSLRAFLRGLLRDRDLAEEALQGTFGKAVSGGQQVTASSFRGWLFQVAYREAMAVRRRQGVEARSLRKLVQENPAGAESPDERLLKTEAIRRVQKALEELPHEQREVVRRRIYEEQTFAEIAAESGVPLGTVLTRMRLALVKLRNQLSEPE